MTSVEKPGTPQEMLAHHGVKGMHWGVHHVNKPTSSQITDARARLGSQQRQLNQQIDRTNLAKPGREQKAEVKKLADLSAAYLKNPDRATALRMTKGEKYVNAFIGVAFPGVGTAAVAIVGGSRVIARKSIEKQQRSS